MQNTIDILKVLPEFWAVILVVLVLLSPLIAWLVFELIIGRFYDTLCRWMDKAEGLDNDNGND